MPHTRHRSSPGLRTDSRRSEWWPFGRRCSANSQRTCGCSSPTDTAVPPRRWSSPSWIASTAARAPRPEPESPWRSGEIGDAGSAPCSFPIGCGASIDGSSLRRPPVRWGTSGAWGSGMSRVTTTSSTCVRQRLGTSISRTPASSRRCGGGGTSRTGRSPPQPCPIGTGKTPRTSSCAWMRVHPHPQVCAGISIPTPERRRVSATSAASAIPGTRSRT